MRRTQDVTSLRNETEINKVWLSLAIYGETCQIISKTQKETYIKTIVLIAFT